MPERTTIRLPQALILRAKRQAAQRGLTLTALIVEGLRQVLAQRGKPSKAKRTPIPVGKASGGLLPGVNLTDFSAFQEIADPKEAGRLKHHR